LTAITTRAVGLLTGITLGGSNANQGTTINNFPLGINTLAAVGLLTAIATGALSVCDHVR